METELLEVFESRRAWVLPRRRSRVERRAKRMRIVAMLLAPVGPSSREKPDPEPGDLS